MVLRGEAMTTSKHMHSRRRGKLAVGAIGAAAVLALAACGKSTTAGTGSTSSPSTSASTSPSAPAATTAAPTANADAAITLMTASIPGVGTVLVNGNGQTFYRLSSERGGKITCTDANGCTKVWPDTELPAGKTAGIAGTGVQANLLGTVKAADGKLYVTYNTYPLYTFSGDTSTGTAKGQGFVSFGGTWTAITPAGAAATLTTAKTAPATTAPGKTAPPTTAPATTAPAATPSPTPSASPSRSGYGY
jgi:predicted lipoprotein with Yx(FWY)xxD motif